MIAGNLKNERFVENGKELGTKRGQWLPCMRWKREKMCCFECRAIDLAIYPLPLSLRYTTWLRPHTHKINKQKPKFPCRYFAIWWSSAKMHLQTYFAGEYSLVCCLVCCGAVFLWAIRSVGNRPARTDGKSFKNACKTWFFQEQMQFLRHCRGRFRVLIIQDGLFHFKNPHGHVTTPTRCYKDVAGQHIIN